MDFTSIVPQGFVWPPPWEPVGADAAMLEHELMAELPNDHVLASMQFAALARRRRSDDVIIATSNPQQPIAIVHLTWKGGVEFHRLFPWTALYANLHEALANWPPP